MDILIHNLEQDKRKKKQVQKEKKLDDREEMKYEKHVHTRGHFSSECMLVCLLSKEFSSLEKSFSSHSLDCIPCHLMMSLSPALIGLMFFVSLHQTSSLKAKEHETVYAFMSDSKEKALSRLYRNPC